MESNPFPDLCIDSPFFLNDIKGRSLCPKCNKSRKFYCYTCFLPLGGDVYEKKVPKVKLPFKIDIIKHPQEVDGKSTAIHAAILAAEDVTIYTYPTIPDYPDKNKILLVFPGLDSISFEDYIQTHCPVIHEAQTRLINESAEPERSGYLTGDQSVKTDHTAGSGNAVLSDETEINNDSVKYGSLNCEKSPEIDITPDEKVQNVVTDGTKDEHKSGDLALKRPSSSIETERESKMSSCIETENDVSCKKLKLQTKYKCVFEKVVFIDSTWHTVHKIAIDERLKGIQKIELKTQKTKFWRHQVDKPDTYLSTIEAIYYCIREYHHYFVAAPYRGEYDNLLFYFIFMYDKIKHMFEGGKYIKAFNQPRPKQK